jgi:Arc/MetJ family transcription regulator
MTTLTILALSALVFLQEAPAEQGTGTPAPETAKAPDTNAAELKGRIHEMRKNLLIGGPKVRQAESEAIDFYGGKAEIVDRRLDSIRAELSEKRATYELALERALTETDAGGQQRAMAEAGELRASISSLEFEATGLEGKRGDLQQMISAVESRDRDRERLLAQIETTDGFELAMDIPMASVGLAPDLPAAAGPSPLGDDALVNDLLARDPRGARKLLFDADPQGYWQRFPLRPDPQVARGALSFPLPDLPGTR